MAVTAAQIAELRLKINEPTNATYTDELLTVRIERKSGDLAAAASEIWLEKATKAMAMDFEADGGKFYASQLHTQAMAMHELYKKQIKPIIRQNPPEAVYAPTQYRPDSPFSGYSSL